MRTLISVVSFCALLVLAGCVASSPVAVDRSVLWLAGEPEKFVTNLGYTNASWPSVCRNSRGDRLFIQFEDYSTKVRKLITVSSNSVQMSELPVASSYCWLNDAGEPLYWYNRDAKSWQFANGYNLPMNNSIVDTSKVCHGDFIPVVDKQTGRQWIARVQSPLKELVPLPRIVWVELLISSKDRLHIFVRMQPEGSGTPDQEDILKYFEYQIDRDTSRLVQSQEFDWTHTAFDFDPETNLLLVRSLDTYFAHGWLVNVQTGQRKRLGLAGDKGLLLKNDVIQKFRAGLSGHLTR